MKPGLIPLLLGGAEQDTAIAADVTHEILLGRVVLSPSVQGLVIVRRFIYMNEDNDMAWHKMQARNGTIINDATVSVALKSSSGASVAATSLT